MHIIILSVMLDTNQFTGYEHTRTVILLALLALISIIMWIVVSLSLIIRFSVVLIMRLLHRRHLRTRETLPFSQMSKQR